MKTLRPERTIDGWVLLQAALLASLRDHYIVPAMAAIFIVVHWFVPVKLEMTARFQQWTASALIVAIASCHVIAFWIRPNVFLYDTILFTIADAALLLQVGWRYLKRPPDAIAPWVGPTGLAVVYVSLNESFDSFRRAEAMLLATLSITWFVIVMRRGSRITASNTDKSPQPSRLIAVSLLAAALVTWPLATSMSRQVESLQQWITETVTLNVTHVENSRSYVRVANLRSILREQTNNPTQVALRVFSERAPGYLRSRVYDTYENAQWRALIRGRRRWDRSQVHQIVKPTLQPPLGIPQPEDGYRVFEITPLSRSPWSGFEVWNDPVRGEVYFLPVDTAFVSGAGEYLAIDANQVVRTGISIDRPYTAFVPRFTPRTRLSAADRQRLLSPIEGLDSRAQTIADEIAANAPSPRAKMQAVEDFFHKNFRYSLKEVPVPPQANAISFFLTERPAAHCEFFASGSVALLRLMNIPCRYVTGYVVREASEYGDYWIARNQNAHAWVEAYDDQTLRWVTLEPTPGMADGEADSRVIAVNSPTSNEGVSIREVLRMSRYWLEPRWRHVWLAAISRWLAKPILLLAAAGMILIMVRLGQKRRTSGTTSANQLQTQLSHRRFVRALRRYQLRRAPGETLHQFACRIRSHEPLDEFLSDAACWFEEYAARRYGPRFDGPHTPLRSPPTRARSSRTARSSSKAKATSGS